MREHGLAFSKPTKRAPQGSRCFKRSGPDHAPKGAAARVRSFEALGRACWSGCCVRRSALRVTTMPNYQRPRNSSNALVLAVVIGFVLLIGIGAAVYFATAGNKGSEGRRRDREERERETPYP